MEHEVKFFISVDGELLEVPQSLMVALAGHEPSLSWFLAGFFKEFPKDTYAYIDDPWKKGV